MRLSHTASRLKFHLFVCMIACIVSSCEDDTFNKQGSFGMLAFEVAAPGNWTDGSTPPADKDKSIKRLSQTGEGNPLYLVTEITEAVVNTTASNVITRGKPIENETAFAENSFGFSAICYTGEWPDENAANPWTTNFAHNIKVSKADQQNTWFPEKKLDWVGSGNIKFFAYHPYAASSDDNAISHSPENQTGVPTLTYTVPDNVTKQIDLMTATAECKGDGTGTGIQNGAVALNFQHALTAVTIKTGKEMLAGKISKITISGIYGSGTYQIGAKKWEPDGNLRTFNITQNIELEKDTITDPDKITTAPDTILNKDEYTFMMIPQTLPQSAKLEIEFTDELTGTPRTLTGTLAGEWGLGKKVTYSISSTGIVIDPVFELTVNRDGQWPNGGYKFKKGVFDVANEPMTEDDKTAYLPVSGFLRDVDITAYVKVTQENAKTQMLELPFKIEYSTDGGTTWKPTESDDDHTYGWKPAANAATKAIGEPIKGAILLPAQPGFIESQRVFEGIATTDGKTDWDLVAHNPLSNHSANCYMVHDHGYYKFPAWYGNTYGNNDPKAYSCDLEVTDPVMKGKILDKFVAGDNNTVANGKIQGVKKAVLIWQDSPDLVTEIEYKAGWVHFRVPKESLNQGNAVIAVLGDNNTILWSWHIWVTHYDWSESISSGVNNEKNKDFLFAPSVLGYCTPHEGDRERTVQMRIKATVPGKGEVIIQPTSITGAPYPPDTEDVITFTQPSVIASVAGDNTYYQWGRKDPMLPGVYNEEIRTKAGTDEQFDIANKVFYSTSEYRFKSASSTVPIGKTITEPYHFFMYSHTLPNPTAPKAPTAPKYPGDEASEEEKAKYEEEKEKYDIAKAQYDKDKAQYDKDKAQYDLVNYKRRHWHNGSETVYKLQTIANFWNSQLIVNGKSGQVGHPNDVYVVKTVYDPSPAGYKIPPPAAFSAFAKPDSALGSGKRSDITNSFRAKPASNEINVGWYIGTRAGKEIFFPATGLRDMGTQKEPLRGTEYGSWPAHSKLTFVATSGFQGSIGSTSGSSTLLFSIDYREHTTNKTQPKEVPLGIIYGTNNAYGFTVLPIRDGQQ